MAAVVLVTMALGGVSAYVWSLITQAEAEGGPTSHRPRPRPLTATLKATGVGLAQLAVTTARELPPRIRTAREARRSERVERDIELGVRRPRFEETAAATLPAAIAAPV